MNIFIITCTFNVSQILIDCAFKNKADAKAYADALNSDKAKAARRTAASSSAPLPHPPEP